MLATVTPTTFLQKTLAENKKYFCVGSHGDSAPLFEDPAQWEQATRTF